MAETSSAGDEKHPLRTPNNPIAHEEHIDSQEDEAKDNFTVDKDIERQSEAQELPIEGTKSEDHDPNIVDYDGQDDPHNPYNWTKKKKWTNGGILSAMTLITYVTAEQCSSP